jgi:hypothetical protein
MADQSIQELCESVKAVWPERLGEGGWYIVLVRFPHQTPIYNFPTLLNPQTSTLITCSKINEAGTVFTQLLTTSHATPERRAHLSNRLKDMLMKQWTVIGIPLAISAVFQLAQAEKDAGMPVPSLDEQTESSYYRHLDLSTVEPRGQDSMRAIYRTNLEPIIRLWGAHQADFQWLEERVIYGLFLADPTFLSLEERSLVVLSSIMAQALPAPTMWHIRGLRRLGVAEEDAETVCDVIKMVGRWCGRDTSVWNRAADVDISE